MKEMTYKKACIYLIIVGLLQLIFILGTLMNFIAVVENSGKMPVYSIYEFETDKHKSFQNPEEVNYVLFTDIHKLGEYMFSLGDFLLGFSLFSMLIVLINIGYGLFSLWYSKWN